MGLSGNSQMGLISPVSGGSMSATNSSLTRQKVGEVACVCPEPRLKGRHGRPDTVLLLPVHLCRWILQGRGGYFNKTAMFFIRLHVTLLPLICTGKEIAGLLIWWLLEKIYAPKGLKSKLDIETKNENS